MEPLARNDNLISNLNFKIFSTYNWPWSQIIHTYTHIILYPNEKIYPALMMTKRVKMLVTIKISKRKVIYFGAHSKNPSLPRV